MNWQSVENIVFEMFGFGFRALDSIEYYNITLLDFWLGLMVIGVIVRLLIARAGKGASSGKGESKVRTSKKAKESSEE